MHPGRQQMMGGCHSWAPDLQWWDPNWVRTPSFCLAQSWLLNVGHLGSEPANRSFCLSPPATLRSFFFFHSSPFQVNENRQTKKNWRVASKGHEKCILSLNSISPWATWRLFMKIVVVLSGQSNPRFFNAYYESALGSRSLNDFPEAKVYIPVTFFNHIRWLDVSIWALGFSRPGPRKTKSKLLCFFAACELSIWNTCNHGWRYTM